MDTQTHTARYHWTIPEEPEHADTPTAWPYPPVRLGFIGLGTMGGFTMETLLNDPRARVVALCDCDADVLARAQAKVEAAAPACPPRCYRDFRELNRDPDVEAVVISTPDHWHTLTGIDAMRNGKDVYIEKPLTLTIAEGRQFCQVAEQTGRICQVGTQQRSSAEFRHAAELVRNGRLGRIQRIEVTLPPNNASAPLEWEPMDVPESLDYDMWLGPAKAAPYHEKRCHYCFRFISDYSGGQLTNWGAHHLDIVQWALGRDDSGPIRVSGHGSRPKKGLFDVPESIDVTWEYADGTLVHAAMGKPATIEFIGTAGTLCVERGRLTCTPPEEQLPPPTASPPVTLEVSHDHNGNFLEAIRTRHQPICPAETGHRSATICHMGNIAIALGRTLNWDPETEQFDDPEANALLSRPIRTPWHTLLH